MRTSAGKDRYLSGDYDLALGPLAAWAAPATIPGLLYCHSNGAGAFTCRTTTYPGELALANAVGERLAVLSGDFGGPSTFGNDTSLSAVGSGKTWLQGASCPVRAKAGKVALLGLSMGAIVATAWAKANPTLVSCIALIIPAVDVDAIRVADVSGIAATINTAYGARTDTATLVSGSATVSDTSAVAGDVGKVVRGTGIPNNTTILSVTGGVSFVMSANATQAFVGSITVGGYYEPTHGAAHNPATFAASLTGIPIKMWVTSDDTYTPLATSQAFATASGATLVNIGAHGHSDSAVAFAPPADVAAFLAANA